MAMKLGTAHKGGRDRMLGHVDRPDVPGYRILERLGGDGRNGVEVWKAEGPGGFHAALRVIRLTADVTPDDIRGLERLRTARHPNLLAAFGSWRVENALILATELPDCSLWDRFLQARGAGEPGLPRDELVDSLAEAARGIDYVNGNGPASPGHPAPGLSVPHGDITPRTILIVGGGIKVADIDALRDVAGPAEVPALCETPLWGLDYAAPERFSGRPSRHSDQYSLAVTYFHLRVGTLPFAGQGAEVTASPLCRRPELTGVPTEERPALARALAEDPDRRWPSCCAFVQALRAAIQSPPTSVEAAAVVAPGPRIPVRRPAGRSSALTLAVAASGVTLAGTLLLASRFTPPARGGRFPTPSARGVALTRSQESPTRPEDVAENSIPAPAAAPSQAPAPAAPALASLQPAPPPAPLPASEVLAAAPEILSATAVPPEAPDMPTTPPPAALPPFDEPTPGPAPARDLPPSPSFGVAAGTASLLARMNWDRDVPAAEQVARPVEPVRPASVPTPVARPPVIHLAAPDLFVVEAGRTASLPVTVRGDGVPGLVEVEIKGLPEGVSALPPTPALGHQDSAASADPTETTRVVQLRAAPNSPEGETLARLIATAGPARAEATVRVSVRSSPAVVARRRGDVLLRRDEFAAAAAAYTESIALDPADPLAFHGRGLAFYGKGDFDPALADVTTALKLRPETPTALNNLGLIRLAKGDPASAITHFDEAIRLDPVYAVVRYNRGRAYAETGSPDKALGDFDEAIRLDPRFAKAFKARADVLTHKGDRDRALADYDEAVRLRPEDPAALNNRGLLLFARGEHHRAIADFDEAIRTSPRYAVVRYNRGRVYAYLGDTVEALGAFEQALRLDPQLNRATQARAEILARANAPTPARTDLGVATRRESLKPNAEPRPPQ